MVWWARRVVRRAEEDLAPGSRGIASVIGWRAVRAGMLCWESDIVAAVVVVILRSGISFEAPGIPEGGESRRCHGCDRGRRERVCANARIGVKW